MPAASSTTGERPRPRPYHYHLGNGSDGGDDDYGCSPGPAQRADPRRSREPEDRGSRCPGGSVYWSRVPVVPPLRTHKEVTP